MDGINGNQQDIFPEPESLISTLVTYLESTTDEVTELHISDAVLDQLNSVFLSPKPRQQITKLLVQKVVRTFDSDDGVLCGRLSAESFAILTKLLLKAEPCLATERGFCLLLGSLAQNRDQKFSEALIRFFNKKTKIGELVLQRLIVHFTDATLQSRIRRWTGLLLCELLKDSEENRERLEMSPIDLQKSLGSIVIESKNSNIKLIAGTIISQQVLFGSNEGHYWPSTFDKGNLERFPDVAIDSSLWVAKFQSFLNDLGAQESHTASACPESFALQVRIDNKIFSAQGNISLAVDGSLSLLIPPLKGSPAQFLDIPFENVYTIATRDFQQEGMPEELIPDSFTDVVLNLSPSNGPSYVHNAVRKLASQIILTLYSVSDADKLVEYVKNERNAQKSKTIKISNSFLEGNLSLSYVELGPKAILTMEKVVGPERTSGVDPEKSDDIPNDNVDNEGTALLRADGSFMNVAGIAEAPLEDIDVSAPVPYQDDYEMTGNDLYGLSPEGNRIQDKSLASNKQLNVYRALACSNFVKMLDVSDLLASPPVHKKASIKSRLTTKDGLRPSGKEAFNRSDTEETLTQFRNVSIAQDPLPIMAKTALMDTAKLSAAGGGLDRSILRVTAKENQATEEKASTPLRTTRTAVASPRIKAISKRPAGTQLKTPTTKYMQATFSTAQPRTSRSTDWNVTARDSDEKGEIKHSALKQTRLSKAVKDLNRTKNNPNTAKLALAKPLAKDCGNTYDRKPLPRDIRNPTPSDNSRSTFQKDVENKKGKSTDWDEAFQDSDNDGPNKTRKVQSLARAKTGIKAALQIKSTAKTPKALLANTTASSKNIESKGVKQPAKTKRKFANPVLPPPRSQRTAAVDAKRQIAEIQGSPDSGKAAVIPARGPKERISHGTLSNDMVMADKQPETAITEDPGPMRSQALETKGISPENKPLVVEDLVVDPKAGRVNSPKATAYVDRHVNESNIGLDPRVRKVRSVRHQHSPAVPDSALRPKDKFPGQPSSTTAPAVTTPSTKLTYINKPAQDTKTLRAPSDQTEVGSFEKDLRSGPGRQDKSSKGTYGLTMANTLRSALSAIQNSPIKLPARSEGETKRVRDVDEEDEHENEVGLILKKIKTESGGSLPKKTAKSSLNDANRDRKGNTPSRARPGVSGIYADLTNYIELSSDSSENGSYYSDGSSLPASPTAAEMQVANKIEEASKSSQSNLLLPRITPGKAPAVKLHSSTHRAHMTPAETKQHHSRLVDDTFLTRSKVVSWGVSGPRNQGRVVRKPPLPGRSELQSTEKEAPEASSVQTQCKTKMNFIALDKTNPAIDKAKTPERSVTPQSTKARCPTLVMPLTDEDVVMNRGVSYSPSNVDFSQKRGSQRTRVEEGGSPIAITRYHSQDNHQAKSLRDTMIGSNTSKTMHDLEKELTIEGADPEDRRLADLRLGDVSPLRSHRPAFSSIHKHGPRSPGAASEIRFVASESMQIIRPAKLQPDPFTSLGPRRNSSFLHKLQASSIKVQSPAKRKLATEKEGPSKRASISNGFGQEPTKAMKRNVSKTSHVRRKKCATEKNNHKIGQGQDPDKTLVNIDCDPALQSSPSDSSSSSSGSSDSQSESSESGDHQESWKIEPEKLWRESLKPHQSNILEVLYHISNELVRHISEQEICIDDLVWDYQRGGTKLLKELEKSHQGDYDEFQAKAQNMKQALNSLYAKAKRRITGGMKQQREDDMKMVEKSWRDEQEDLLRQMKTALTLANA